MLMIGQKNIIDKINYLINNNTFPRFSILVGPEGSGKKTLCKEINIPGYIKYMAPDVKIDSIRELIDTAYKKRNMIFIIPSADDMSNAAQNSLLKIVEECPNDNYFIMTLNDMYSTLPTIISRAQTFFMEPYSKEELQEYIKSKYSKLDSMLVLEVCDTPGEINLLAAYNIQEFWDYVVKVVDNIVTTTGSNSFKIAEKVAIKEEDGYDLRFFWKAFERICMKKALQEESGLYLEWIRCTSQCIGKLSVKSINKQMLFDMWILNIRKVGK